MQNNLILQAFMKSIFKTTGAEATVVLIDDPKHTKYLWGDINEIVGKPLKLIERSAYNGDCLCICEKGLVDVHHQDIKQLNA
jgi:hypothetical protein